MEPVALPDGTEVEVRVEPLSPSESSQSPTPDATDEFVKLPFFGMWAGREDMGDGADWVNAQRAKWQERSASER